MHILLRIAAFRDGVRPDSPHDVCFAALGEVEGEKRPSQREYRRLASSQSVDDMLDLDSCLGAFRRDHDRVVAGNRAQSTA